MLVAWRLAGRGCAVMMTAQRTRQLAGGGHHCWSNEDQHEQAGYRAREHCDHPNTTGPANSGRYNATRRRRSALAMTDTELNVMAALAIIGLRSTPNTGYSTPAATGTPRTL